ncbi:MAG: hypothetical protein KA419_09520 [Acidobacteria bacterium]|nr:hypothetical protein [Acidobacteriota bacterium]
METDRPLHRFSPRHAFSATLAAVFLCALVAPWAPACTTAVISGAATADGRPILWKNRDADDLHNELFYGADGRYAYVGVVNHGDADGLQIWAGLNEKGFAVMNSASYNLGDNEDTKAEGMFMKRALQCCATVEDFQALLERGNDGLRDVAANFGVIDARGGAAFFETCNGTYKRYDATDPAQAPRGFLVRSNYSHSGKPDKGTGFLREARALRLITDLADAKNLTPRSLLSDVCRDVANPHIGSDPNTESKSGDPEYAYVGDSIARQDTSSVFVAAGVKAGEDPVLATAWVVLGLPTTGAAVPVWVGAGSVPPQAAASRKNAPLNEAFARIGRWLCPDQRGDLRRYIRRDRWSDPGGGVRALLFRVEAESFRKVEAQLAAWRKETPTADGMAGFQNAVARDTLAAVNRFLAGLDTP